MINRLYKIVAGHSYVGYAHESTFSCGCRHQRKGHQLLIGAMLLNVSTRYTSMSLDSNLKSFNFLGATKFNLLHFNSLQAFRYCAWNCTL